MMRSRMFTIGLLAIAVTTWPRSEAQAQPHIDAFQRDVHASVQDGLQWLRDNDAYTSPDGNMHFARGMMTVAMLDQPEIGGYGVGYDGLNPEDQALIRSAISDMMGNGGCSISRPFYSFCHGAILMALSLYAKTGGPEVDNPWNWTLRQGVDKLVDDTLFNQTARGIVTPWAVEGFWGYTSVGRDSPSTQYAAAGLGAARGFYMWANDAEADNRLAEIDNSLGSIAESYERYRTADGGFGYRPWEASSHTQTPAALWISLLGGADVNAAGIQDFMNFMVTRYVWDRIGGMGYYYYLWVSTRAFGLFHTMRNDVHPGNWSVYDVGAMHGQHAGRSPLLAQRPQSRGAGNPGFYADTPPSWYFDFALTLMEQQNPDGEFNRSGFGSWNVWFDQASALLVLERSLGAACPDTDGDDICNDDDNCALDVNPEQEDADFDHVGDVCDLCPGEDDEDIVFYGAEVVCPSVCENNTAPVPVCPHSVEVEVDDECSWQVLPEIVGVSADDAEGHRVDLYLGAPHPRGLGIVPVDVTAADECGLTSDHFCQVVVVPRDVTPPVVEQERAGVEIGLRNAWVYNWTPIREACGVTWVDNCTNQPTVRYGIVSIESNDPDEVIEGEPGAFFSGAMAADWYGLILDLDRNRAGERIYDVEFAIVDEFGHTTTTHCGITVVN